MQLNMNWKNFRSIHGEEGSRSKFENLMYDLLCYEYPSEKVHKTDSSRGGDGGIDIFVERDDGVDIYQCKFFLDKVENVQWNQISNSFDSALKTAEKDDIKVLKWYLCTPFILNRDPVGPWKRWNQFVDQNVERIEESMEWLDGARIIQKLEQSKLGDIRVKYFTSSETVFKKEETSEVYKEDNNKSATTQVVANAHPKVFISYSWTTEVYKARVLDLAKRLRRSGVDVILDQWELKPGHDMYAFMEQSIRAADKVLILCDKGYSSKADNRTGGVGAETQIITPDVYGKHKQEKFIPVIMEKPTMVPSYLKSRYAVYFINDEEEEYRNLCRAIFGINREKKPPLGEVSFDWLTDDSVKYTNLPSDIIAGADSLSSRHIVLHKGDKYEFGHYPKNKDGKDEPLTWRVLDVDIENSRALLITENLIDCREYHEEWKSAVWAKCDLRKWLNGEFIDKAFDKEDLGKIAEISIQNQDNIPCGKEDGITTKDKVFALSLDEAQMYFRDDKDRRAAVTPYAKKQGSFYRDDYITSDGQPAGWWWLRSPDDCVNILSSFISGDGSIHSTGNIVSSGDVSVRPTLWMNL